MPEVASAPEVLLWSISRLASPIGPCQPDQRISGCPIGGPEKHGCLVCHRRRNTTEPRGVDVVASEGSMLGDRASTAALAFSRCSAVARIAEPVGGMHQR